MSGTTNLCRAKIFLSCGQGEEPERHAAREIKSYLEGECGFDVFVATEVTSLSTIEDIIEQLKSSEYFLSIDFARDPAKASGELPISLFSHQELAIAKSCGIESAFVQQEGCQRLGLAKYVFTNPLMFSDVGDIVPIVAKAIEKTGWTSGWKKALYASVGGEDEKVRTAVITADGHHHLCAAKFFHIRVENKHRYRPATRSVVYLVNVVDKKTGKVLDNKWPIEHKWAGYLHPEAFIRPGQSREFDVFFMPHKVAAPPRSGESSISYSNTSATISIFSAHQGYQVPSVTDALETFSGRAYFNTLTDYTGYQMPLKPGQYEFTYEIWSEQFPRTVAKFEVNVGQSVDSTSIKLLEQSHDYV